MDSAASSALAESTGKNPSYWKAVLRRLEPVSPQSEACKNEEDKVWNDISIEMPCSKGSGRAGIFMTGKIWQTLESPYTEEVERRSWNRRYQIYSKGNLEEEFCTPKIMGELNIDGFQLIRRMAKWANEEEASFISVKENH